MSYETFILGLGAAVAILAAAIDAKTRRIPNWLVGPFFLVAIIVRYSVEGRLGLWDGLAGCGLALLATLPFYWLGGLGLGDCKLLGALGASAGLYRIVFVLFGTAMAGGFLALIYASGNGQLRDRLRSTAGVITGWTRHGIRRIPEVNLDSPDALSIPYGPAIAAGVLFSFFYV